MWTNYTDSQAVANDVFRELLNVCVLVSLDDIVSLCFLWPYPHSEEQNKTQGSIAVNSFWTQAFWHGPLFHRK